MEVELKTDTKISYILSYIRKKYPMYCAVMKSADFGRLANEIQFSSIIRSASFNDVKNGTKDKFIDDFVEHYARNNLNSLWANFEFLTNYIKSVLLIRGEKSTEIGNEILQVIARDIAIDIVRENPKDYTKFTNGSYDDIYLVHYRERVDEIYSDCLNKVKEIVSSSKKEFEFDDDTYEYICELITSIMLRKYDLNALNKNKVLRHYMVISKQIVDGIRNRIRSVVDQIDLPLGIPLQEVIDFFMNEVKLGNVSAKDILDGVKDSVIEVEAIKRKKDVNIKKTSYDDVFNSVKKVSSDDVFDYIYNFISKLNDRNLPKKEVYCITENIYDRLLNNSKHVVSFTDVINHKYDVYIERCFDSAMIRYSSIKKEGVQSTVDYKVIKKKALVTVSTLLLVGAISLSTYGLVRGTIRVAKDFVTDVTYNSSSSYLGRSRYLDIHTKYNDGFKVNAQEIVNDYNNYKLLENDNYRYLGFYEAYRHVMGNHRLAVMDSMLRNVQRNIPSIQNSTFLSFAYDRLLEMGCDEIRDDKYKEAVEIYEFAMIENDDEDKTTYECLTSGQKKLVEEIMRYYDYYSARLYGSLKNSIISIDDATEYENGYYNVGHTGRGM